MNVTIDSVIHLLHATPQASLATQSRDMPGYPYLSVLPFVLDEHHSPVFLISGLAEHTRNLAADARAALLVAEPAEADVQAGARLTILGAIQPFEPPPPLIQRALRYQPSAARLLQLPDFRFARMHPERLRFIEGFGRMGWVEGEVLVTLPALGGELEAQLLADLDTCVPEGVRLLGIDRWGVDLIRGCSRHRLPFPTPPLSDPALGQAVLVAVASLGAAHGARPGR